MEEHIQKALGACLHTYGEMAEFGANELLGKLIEVFELEAPYLEKVSGLDAAFDDHPRFEELREIVFDLLLMNFFAADVEKLEADYLESEEWEAIEEQTIERGTELLNLLLYLRECADEDIEPQLVDYLKEFLLVDEDEFQDEYRIYEPVIANQILTDTSYDEIAKVASKIPENQELAEFFYPLMGFFYEQNPSEQDLEDYARSSANPAFETAVYKLLTAYNR
ncbi:hypothetical protein [Parapedobacter tibetensis]|uniref:hypothetical protein n=1 Tax=Parapedobacter tibetensis TaxID=2972951 RepID=UPI00214D2CE2|nr:hypothetical protein [Parapedobacter tibetensis]